MNAAAHIGRVGALAVALGIGAAMTCGAGVACADDSASNGSHAGTSHAGSSKPVRHTKTTGHQHDADTKTKGTNDSSTVGADTSAAVDTASASTGKAQRDHKKSSHRANTDTAAAATSSARSKTSDTRHQTSRTATDSAASGSGATAAATAVSSTSSGALAGPLAASSPAAVSAVSAGAVETSATSSSTTTAKASLPSNLTGWFRTLVYTPLHALAQLWITSALGVEVDSLINRLAGSYVIGNGRTGTAANPTGGAGGWLIGDGGLGWTSTVDGTAGGDGGAGGLLGNGGAGGDGAAGAAGGDGGKAGLLMGIGGAGGDGGASTDGGEGGSGGTGGSASASVLFGVGGEGGSGGKGADGGRGGNGGDGARWLGTGGAGGDAGASGVGGDATELVALGGAGGNAGLLGNHGAVGTSGTGGPTTQATSSGLLTITPTGMTLTNSDGQVVILHGFNEVYKIEPYDPASDGFGTDDAEFLAANGFNVVRLGIIWAALEPEPGVYNTAYLDSIKSTVNMLAGYGIYTMLDMHQDLYSSSLGGEGAPAWATLTNGAANVNSGFPGSYYLNPAEYKAWDNFWNNVTVSNGLGLEDSYAAAWQQVASVFAGNNAVIGYDIMNEPFAGTSWLPTLLGSPFFGDQQLTPLYNQVAAAIRSVDPNTALIVEPANPATSEITAILGLPVNLGKIYDPHVILAFHDYCAGSATSGICGWLASQQANTAYAYGKAHDIPVIMNEFGASDASYDLNSETNAANALLMSWADWAYSGSGDITTSGSLLPESLVYDPNQPPTGDNVNTKTLTLLAAPYPQLISGTPKAWTWKNGIFTFSYSTEKVDGSGTFADGSQTVISVPQVEFPNGYTVSVTGGQVLSAANAAALVVVSDGTAGTIKVVVTAKPASD